MKHVKLFKSFNESMDVDDFESQIEEYIDGNSDYLSSGSLCSKVEDLLDKEDGSITDKSSNEGGKKRISILYNNEELLGILVDEDGMLDCGLDESKYGKQYRFNQDVYNKIV